MIPKNLEKQFAPAINGAKAFKKMTLQETEEEKIERLMKQLGIQKHGKGKRKKRSKKKGGK
jgi:hypothetical protein